MSSSASLYGIVDLGTWTIRFSINSIQPHHARTLPCVFQDRAPIRLYKGSDVPITPQEIEQTLVVLQRFCSICKDYGVSRNNVQIAANPNEAPNFEELTQEIYRKLNLEVLRLSKEGEHWANAYGVASSVYEARGIYIELRPSYVNVYYLSLCHSDQDNDTLIGPVKVSYTNLSPTSSSTSFQVKSINDPSDSNKVLEEPHVRRTNHELADFEDRLTDALATLLTQAKKKNIWSSQVFLSGSGFSGLHSILATACRECGVVTTGLVLRPQSIASVVPSTRLAQVVRSVGVSLPNSTARVIFVHHNLRNGLLFQALPPAIRRQDPLIVATKPYALPGAHKLAVQLQQALPKELCPTFIRDRLVFAASNSAYINSSYSTEVQPISALVLAESGLLASTQGVTHEEKVLLGLVLCQRWGGNLDSTATEIRSKMIASLSDPELAWWARYTGLVLHLLGAAYPGAHVRSGALELMTEVAEDAKSFTLKVRMFKDSVYSDNVIMKQRILRTERQMNELMGPVKLEIYFE